MKEKNKQKSDSRNQTLENLLDMPERYVYLRFFIDTNRINSRESLPFMKQLEEWRNNDVILIEMPIEAFQEAIVGGNLRRIEKARSYGRPIVTDRMQDKYKARQKKIESILFPSGAKTQDQLNDVQIVLNAGYYRAILITNDGASERQPNGILGNRSKLEKLGIQVVRDEEAVELVRQKIKERDKLAESIARKTGKSLPQWVGKD